MKTSKIENFIKKYEFFIEEVNKLKIKINELDEEINKYNQSIEWVQTKKINILSSILTELQFICNFVVKEIFGNEYEFIIEIDEDSQRKQINFLIKKNNEKFDPKYELGGGVIDLLSFCLRIAIWSLNPTKNIILLDEPFKFLSKDKQQLIPILLQKLSNELKLQFIIVTHEELMGELNFHQIYIT